MMAAIAAARLVEHLERAGFLIINGRLKPAQRRLGEEFEK